jgi:hypothetical protein
MTYEPEYAHRFTWLLSFHLYVAQVERRFNSEMEASIEADRVREAFRVLLGEGYNDKIKHFEIRVSKIEPAKNKGRV